MNPEHAFAFASNYREFCIATYFMVGLAVVFASVEDRHLDGQDPFLLLFGVALLAAVWPALALYGLIRIPVAWAKKATKQSGEGRWLRH